MHNGESIRETKRPVHVFRGFRKSFRLSETWNKLETLRRFGVGEADIRIIAKLYWKQKAVVRIEDEMSGWVIIEKGMRRECVLFPGTVLALPLASIE